MITPEQALEAYKKYESKRKASQELGIPRTTFRRLLKKAGFQEPKDDKQVIKEFNKDSAVITTKSLNISTLDEALKHSGVDLSIWDVDKYTINSWEVTMGREKTPSGKPETYTNYQVKVWLKRKIADEKEIAFENLINRLAKETPVKPTPKLRPKEDILVVPGLVDSHFGLLAWGKETGEGDYDLKESEYLYVNAVEEGINLLKGYEISQFMFPVGSDFFHINSPDNSTPKNNNPLDVDSRLIKVFEVGEMAVVRSIERAASVAPVKILWVPGNHDPETSYYLCKVVQAYFKNNPNVEVDVSPQMRKFHKHGENLIGVTHGDEEPHKNLPTIMADSCPDWWGQTKHREWLVGHVHKKKEMNFIGVDSFGSTIIRFLPSLCKIDQWHYRKGYVGGDKSAEFLCYNKNGMMGYFPVYQRALSNA